MGTGAQSCSTFCAKKQQRIANALIGLPHPPLRADLVGKAMGSEAELCCLRRTKGAGRVRNKRDEWCRRC